MEEFTKSANSAVPKQASLLQMCNSDCTISSKVRLEKEFQIPTAFQTFWLGERADNYPVFRMSGWSKQNITFSLDTLGDLQSHSYPRHLGRPPSGVLTSHLWQHILLLEAVLFPRNAGVTWSLAQRGTNRNDECPPRRVYSGVLHA